MKTPQGQYPQYRNKAAGKKTSVLVFCLVMAGVFAETPQQADLNPAAGKFTRLEERLVEAQVLRMHFEVSAAGAVSADLRGDLSIEADGAIHLQAAGNFAGSPVELFLDADRQNLSYGNNSSQSSVPRPARLGDALLIGLTRMGILHNLAMLSGAAAPDHAAGGVREWVVADRFSADVDPADVIHFQLTVAGDAAGTASLQLDSRGLPLLRQQRVQFPQGEMRVVERYSSVVIKARHQ